VLYEGRQIYFGNIYDAKKFFVNLGFHCPERQTTADFLTSLTSPSERIVRPGFEHKTPRTPDEFAVVWQESEDRAKLMREIHDLERQYPVGGPQLEKFRQSRRAVIARNQCVSKIVHTIFQPH
jgi:ATP-binding cassette, subfamily G (WHITE), member 2, PDR